MKKALMIGVAILAIGLFLAVSGKQDRVLAGNPPTEADSVGAPIALANGRIDLSTSKIATGNIEAKLAYKGVTIRCGKKCHKAASMRR